MNLYKVIFEAGTEDKHVVVAEQHQCVVIADTAAEVHRLLGEQNSKLTSIVQITRLYEPHVLYVNHDQLIQGEST